MANPLHEEDGPDAGGGEDQEEHPSGLGLVVHSQKFQQFLRPDANVRLQPRLQISSYKILDLGLEKMRGLELEWGCPVSRPRSWEEDKRKCIKELENKNWFRKGGYNVSLFVPHTPGGEIVNRMKTKESQIIKADKLDLK